MRSRIVWSLAALVLAAGCGERTPSPEAVVRAWSAALNTDDNEAAADLFAPSAEVIQRRTYVLRTREQAIAFNASLPCSGEIVELESEGETVRATFRLGDRKETHCDAPGAKVRAAFRVHDGRIVRWRQLPATALRPAGGNAVY